MQHHNYSLTELENLMPFEREIYINMLLAFIEQQQAESRERAGSGGG
jgi:hypothetical protein